ncbi:MFS transporter [Streptomyces sp. NPDC048361]|uniref:MFS transporter n=1 Tax=Streptomyces sp. NPDC048361 TaxID=3154720 RepID=UPI003413A322
MSALEPSDAGLVDLPPQETGDVGEGGILGPERRALSVGIITVVLLIAFEATAVGTAMPVAARELGGVSLYAFAFSAYFTTSLFGMVVAGQWADRRGPLGALGVGISGFAAGLLLSGTALNMWTFIAGRAVQGLGGGLVIVALYVVIGRAYPARLQPTIMAAFAAGWVVPSVVGPLVAGTVTEQLGWRWVFIGIPVLVVFPLALALPATRRMASGPADPTATVEPFDRRRIKLALGISVGAGLLQYAGQDVRWLSVLPLVAGAALLGPAVTGRRALLPHGTWRAARGLPSVVLLRGIAAGSFITAESFVPLMLVTQRGLTPTMAGLSLAVGGVTWALGSYVQARPRMEAYRERLMVVGMVQVALAIVVAPSVLVAAVPVWVVAVAWGVGCFGMGMVITSTSVLLLKLSAPHEAGANSAALQISDGLSNVLLLAAGGAGFAALGGGAVTGVSGSHPGAFLAVFLPMAVVAVGGAWVAVRVRRPDPTPPLP